MPLPSPKRLLLPLAAVLTLTACADDTDRPPAPPDGTEPVASNDVVAAANDAGLTTFVTLADSAGLTALLQGEGPYTAFIPTNEAFEALPQSLRDSLLVPENRDRLRRILQYHVLEGRIETNMLAGPMSVETVEGAELTLEADEAGFAVRDGQGSTVAVVTPDVNVFNGVVHVVDRVLMPPQDGDAEPGETPAP
jgi:uncharacterized surface protein with fasciclin (FAS1) repeats